MESVRTQNDLLTPSQRQAVTARGNVLVMAGAGTGKTHTLVERCLDCLCRERASLDEILVVTFTEAAAAKMKQRLRAALESILDSRSLGAPENVGQASSLPVLRASCPKSAGLAAGSRPNRQAWTPARQRSDFVTGREGASGQV